MNINFSKLFKSNNCLKHHSYRVSLYAKFISEKLNCSREFINEIFKYSCLHDIGKIKIENKILDKPGKLTIEEFEIIKKHPLFGIELISDLNLSKIVKNLILYHHEKWDGTGYPCSLCGNNIPLEARIVGLRDVYDALRENRCYKVGFYQDRKSDV